ncbi:MAG: hypothetical protein VYE26_04905 [Pseudomonadota bacterium]|mgnify:CR=1 FL=1|nr:hypothetical protein [Pseudomonadota bacterium]|tara:strand:- start:1716 stop:1865 length:150 start_codon:yes stop_codon:yes gene_type:complete
MSVIIYQEHCEYLEKKNEELKEEILFLKTQLEFKTMGFPDYENMDRESA